MTEKTVQTEAPASFYRKIDGRIKAMDLNGRKDNRTQHLENPIQ